MLHFSYTWQCGLDSPKTLAVSLAAALAAGLALWIGVVCVGMDKVGDSRPRPPRLIVAYFQIRYRTTAASEIQVDSL